MRRTLILASLALASTLAGCAEGVRAYRFDEHAIRIDPTRGAAHAQVFVDECPVEGLYYDRLAQQWGVEGHTDGASYWDLDELAEDMAAWGVARCDARSTFGGELAARADEGPPAVASTLASRKR